MSGVICEGYCHKAGMLAERAAICSLMHITYWKTNSCIQHANCILFCQTPHSCTKYLSLLHHLCLSIGSWPVLWPLSIFTAKKIVFIGQTKIRVDIQITVLRHLGSFSSWQVLCLRYLVSDLYILGSLFLWLWCHTTAKIAWMTWSMCTTLSVVL